MVKGIYLSFLFTLLVFSAKAQSENAFVRKGLVKATATISPGFFLRQSGTYVYLNGDMEYFPENRVSFRGDGYWMVGAQQKPALLAQNHSFLFGALYHFPKNRFDYFLGFQPGVSLVKSNNEALSVSYPLKVAPIISCVTGVTYYVHDYFNFFINVRYLNGRYFTYEQISLSEIRISAGLGFQIHTKK